SVALTGRQLALRPTYDAQPYDSPQAFQRDLRVIADSLNLHHGGVIAAMRLNGLIQAVSIFGFHLATVDLRQSSDVHERVLTELFRASGARHNGKAIAYDRLSEQERIELLRAEIKEVRPLVSPWIT